MTTIEVVEFRDELAPAFERLNRAWIERHFRIEPGDEAVLADPRGRVVAAGGQVLFLVEDGEAVGTCALVPHGSGGYELAKMAVAERVRGRGLGDRLMAAAVAWARAAGAKRLILVTNSGLTPAMRLYRKHGFRLVPLEPGHGYTRADVQMELDLSSG